jgi:hypothetical protein
MKESSIWSQAFRYLLLSGFLLQGAVSYGQQATLSGDTLSLPVVQVGDQVFRVSLTLVTGTDPLQFQFSSADELTDADISEASTFSGATLSVPSIIAGGVSYWAEFTLISEAPVLFSLAGGGVIADGGGSSCMRPEPDPSNGIDNPLVIANVSVPAAEIIQGAAGPDAIPAIEFPLFTQDFDSTGIQQNELVVGVKIGDEVRAYPHEVLDWHEVINEQFQFEGQEQAFTLSYCPLTGSAMMWKGFSEATDKTFGTSGFLYNSNLVMYDRETQTLWSQMLEQGIAGPDILRIPEKFQVVETTWGTWSAMYPETTLLTSNTGFSRPYGSYPYGNFRQDNSLLFEVDNLLDDRLHRKERVLGITVGQASKVYPISRFPAAITTINERVGDMDIVATGSSNQNFGVAFNRQLEDCTVLDFTPVENQLPVVMQDNEGNQWDVFGTAVTGPRTGTQLQKTNSFVAYWYAWTAFFPGAEIQP